MIRVSDMVSSILAKVDWADDEDLLNLDWIKGFAIFISQARCSSSSVGADSRRGVRVSESKRKSDPASKKGMKELSVQMFSIVQWTCCSVLAQDHYWCTRAISDGFWTTVSFIFIQNYGPVFGSPNICIVTKRKNNNKPLDMQEIRVTEVGRYCIKLRHKLLSCSFIFLDCPLYYKPL